MTYGPSGLAKVEKILETAKTKKDIVKALKQTLSGVYDYADGKQAIALTVNHRVFKGEDYAFYFEAMQTPSKADFRFIDLFTKIYINSDKFRIEDADLVIQYSPWFFINSDHFTLEMFNKYYYMKSHNRFCQEKWQQLKHHMLVKISTL